jgi:hypothetical protein
MKFTFVYIFIVDGGTDFISTFVLHASSQVGLFTSRHFGS